ncbi:Transmembrane 9 superfamily member 2 [Tupaia chinensis]|uniref:Transmembrane 9 superfamily member 2 n=1 Tax=Tupaia chinensis TaxID=246437 RepID=L9J9C3_TUPCH|nr:Transmembrane 9 superfamily member 2 [Tupaia chinensis]
MCARGFCVGTVLWCLWAALSRQRWLLGLELLLGLQATLGTAFYLPGLGPVSFCEADRETESCQPELYKKNTFYLFNHVDITITYHREDDTDQNIAKLVTARLDPKSYKHSDENHLTCDGPPMEIPKEYTDKLNVTYTYSVKFERIFS